MEGNTHDLRQAVLRFVKTILRRICYRFCSPLWQNVPRSFNGGCEGNNWGCIEIFLKLLKNLNL